MSHWTDDDLKNNHNFNALCYRITQSVNPFQICGISINIHFFGISMVNPGIRILEHQHPNYEFAIVLKGGFSLRGGKQQIKINSPKDRIIFIPPSTLHQRYFNENSNSSIFCLTLELKPVNDSNNDFLINLPRKLINKNFQFSLSNKMKTLFSFLITEFSEQLDEEILFRQHILKAFITLFFLDNFSELTEKNTKKTIISERIGVADIMELISNRINSAQSPLDFISQCCRRSSKQLNRIFKKATGKTISNVWQEKRIEHAKNLLISSGLPISEVGKALGFKKISLFSLFIKRHTGMSPSEFQKKYQKL